MRASVLAWVTLSFLAGCTPSGGDPPDGGATPDAGPSLRVSSVTPASGPAGGGTSITVTGSGFRDGVTLFIGDAEATEVSRMGENRLTAKTPPTSLAGVAVDVRVVSLEDAEAVLPAAFRYDAAPGVSEAVMTTQLPAELESLEDAATVALTAEVNAPGVTDGAGPAPGVRAQFGFGAQGSAPASFTWTDGTFLSDGAGGRDSFSGSVSMPVPPGQGDRFDLAARFSLDNGASWTVASPVLTATVRRPLVQWCKLGGVGTGPEVLSVLASSAAREVYVQLYHPALTESPGAAAGLEVEWGLGAVSASPDAWAWSAGSFNVQNGNDDEWKGALAPPAVPGAYLYAARARLRGGPWRLCDGDGSDNGFDAAQAGQLSVTTPASFSCALQPLAGATLPGGAALEAAVTASGGAAGLRLQVGLGAAGSDPAQSPLWGWAEATQGVAPGSWSATLHPAYSGDRAVAARASDDNGQTWTVCTGAQPLAVTGVAAAGYCNLQYPPSVTVASAGTTTVYGQLYQAGLTEAAGAPAGVVAELGHGKSTEDPGAAWTWTVGTWNVQVGNNDEFQALLPAAAAVAGTSYAWRFNVGGAYCYGDLDGNTPGGSFSGEGAGGQPNLGTVLP